MYEQSDSYMIFLKYQLGFGIDLAAALFHFAKIFPALFFKVFSSSFFNALLVIF